jgi:hypothetical protein
VLVVDDLMADIDRRTEPLERALDDRDRSLDSSAKAPRLGKHDPKRWLRHGRLPPDPIDLSESW